MDYKTKQKDFRYLSNNAYCERGVLSILLTLTEFSAQRPPAEKIHLWIRWWWPRSWQHSDQCVSMAVVKIGEDINFLL